MECSTPGFPVLHYLSEFAQTHPFSQLVQSLSDWKEKNWKERNVWWWGRKKGNGVAVVPSLLPSPLLSSVQSLSCVWFFATPWTAAHQASLSITNFQSLLKLTSVKSVMPSNHLILCHPLLLPWVFPSNRVFSNESVLPIRCPKYWSFSFNISHSNEYSELISFRIDLLWSPCSPRDSQESSPTPQFKSINSSALTFLYSPTHIHTWLMEKP